MPLHLDPDPGRPNKCGPESRIGSTTLVFNFTFSAKNCLWKETLEHCPVCLILRVVSETYSTVVALRYPGTASITKESKGVKIFEIYIIRRFLSLIFFSLYMVSITSHVLSFDISG